MGTQYRYRTHDGGPPSNGIPPTMTGPGPRSFPFSNLSFGAPYSDQFFSSPFYPGSSNPFSCQSAPLASGPLPAWFCQQVRPAQGPGGSPPKYWQATGFQPVPQAVPVPPDCLGNKWMLRPPAGKSWDDGPVPGGRLDGELGTFKSKQGYIFPRKISVFHITIDGSKPYEWEGATHKFQKYSAASYQPIDEFIELVGAIKNAPPGTPRESIGISEVIEQGGGRWIRGATYLLGDLAATKFMTPDGVYVSKTLEQIGWVPQRGQAGLGKPITICFEPGVSGRPPQL